MATVIHHGAPGSYKSFTLVQRFVIPFLKEGRVIVTNIRGLDNPATIVAAFPDFDFPSSAKIIFVDCTTQQGRYRMARWFHWCPIGAQIFIDELQEIYPVRSDFKMTELDTYIPLQGEIIEQTSEPRPCDIFVAFDKQRHYNWNLYCSTTNIAKVKKEIRQVSEWAYRHRDTSGLLPWKKNTWIEHQHDPETSGKSASHRVGLPVEYKADPRIFKCYSSTTTGSHEQSKAGRSILSDPKIRAVIFVFFCSFSYLLYNLVPRFIASEPIVKDIAPPVFNDTAVFKKTAVTSAPDVVVRSHDVLSTQKTSASATVLTRDLVIKWSLSMTDVDLLSIPLFCRVSYPSVFCKVIYSRELFDVARNYTCEQTKTLKICTLMFLVHQSHQERPSNSLGITAALK